MSEIVLLADRYLPHAGGSRVYYHNLYSRMARRGRHRLTVLTSRVPNWREFDHQQRVPGLTLRRAGSSAPDLCWRAWPSGAGAIVRALACVQRQKPDAVHAGDLLPQGLAAYAAKQLFGSPYLAFCHGEEITLTEARRVQRPLRNRIYRHADHVVAACELARERLLALGIPAERITKITPGIDEQRFCPSPRSRVLRQRWMVGEGPMLLTVARLTARKGQDVILRALPQVLAAVPHLVYVIAGTGPERERLEALCEQQGIAHAVRFLGQVTDDELTLLYQQCDAFVMMNRETDGDSEGFGMVFLEASACGKPVIGGRSGGTAESILDGRSGFRLPSEDVRGLAMCLTRLLTDEALRSELGDAGLRYAHAHFSWAERAESLEQVSDAMLAGASRAKLHALSPRGVL